MADPTAKDVVRAVARYVARNAQKESAMYDPYASWEVGASGLLDALSAEFQVPEEEIGAWVDEAHDSKVATP